MIIIIDNENVRLKDTTILGYYFTTYCQLRKSQKYGYNCAKLWITLGIVLIKDKKH